MVTGDQRPPPEPPETEVMRLGKELEKIVAQIDLCARHTAPDGLRRDIELLRERLLLDVTRIRLAAQERERQGLPI